MIEVQFKDFNGKFEALLAEKKPFIGIFTTEKDQNGDTWCPDCKKASPFLPEIAETASKHGWKTYVFYVGAKEVYKDPQHPFRQHNLIKLKCVPTVAYFDGKTFSKRLEEAEILEKDMRDLLFQS